MDFALNEEQRMLKKTVAEFVDREVVPIAQELDEKGEFPMALFRKLGELGFLAMRYPEEYGGVNADMTSYCIFCEELARGSMSLAACAAMQSLMGTNFVYRFGTTEQKKRLLIPALKGEKIGSFALTEPDAGSDLAAIRTTARKEEDGWVLNGSKTWVTSGTLGDFFTVLASTDRSKGLEGLDFFLVEKGTPGFSVGRKIEKLGVRASENTELALEDVRLPLDSLLGEEQGRGFVYLQEILNNIRIMTGALSIGIARAAYEEGLRYAKQRVQFGRPIGKFQAIKFKLADMATELEAARWLVYYAAWLADQGKPNTKEAAMSKLYASEAANKIADETCRIHASYGFSMDYSAQRYFRDARFLLPGAGTSEILRLIIGRELRL